MTGRAWFVLGLGLGSLIPAITGITVRRLFRDYAL